MTNSELHSALGKPGVACNRLMAGLHFSRSRQGQPAPQIEINHKRGRLLVVTDEIAHKTFDDVKVKANCFHDTILIMTIAVNVFVDASTAFF